MHALFREKSPAAPIKAFRPDLARNQQFTDQQSAGSWLETLIWRGFPLDFGFPGYVRATRVAWMGLCELGLKTDLK